MRVLSLAAVVTCAALGVACGKGQDAGALPSRPMAGPVDTGGRRACNGHPDLCERRFDEVVFAGTHNSSSAREYGYSINANQQSGLARQLEDGVRVLLMDVYPGDPGNVFCHGICALGSTPHLDGLARVKRFLDDHPNEVVTFIYEDRLESAALAADLETSGLAASTFTHEPGATWPTLGEMIDRGTRLVVVTEEGRPPPAWLHHAWDLVFDTPFTFFAEAELSCATNRGSSSNALFLLNHWLSTTPPLNLPSEDGARRVNSRDVLLSRAERCREETGHLPNFVAVDFYEVGDLFTVVATLNGLL